jgi:hypothetical protein
VTLTADTTAHVKGGYQQIVASAVRPVAGLRVHAEADVGGANNIDSSMLLDISFGASGVEVVQVANIPVGAHHRGATWFLPLYIPAGTEVRCRIQGAVTSDTYLIRPTLVYGGRAGAWGGYSIADTIGVDTATSGPTTGDLTDNAWDEAVASTAQAYRALTLHMCLPPADTTAQAGIFTIDIGVGAAGVEQALGTFIARTTTSEGVERLEGPHMVEAEIPAGSRLAIRKNSTNDLSGALIGWA